jgi:hypothetical protein
MQLYQARRVCCNCYRPELKIKQLHKTRKKTWLRQLKSRLAWRSSPVAWAGWRCASTWPKAVRRLLKGSALKLSELDDTPGRYVRIA